MAYIIGTAGHAGHGKTSLIRALTGFEADCQPSEKERTDIATATFDLPGVGQVSIVDAPGHERFLTNMLVSALGVDVAILCVAADEGVMPQAREHLKILDLLPVQAIVVAITKSDLADGEAREQVSTDVRGLLSRTRFSEAATVLVSTTTGDGLESLRSALSGTLFATPQRDTGSEPWYLPIERAFTIKDHGCVVTGTLAQGRVNTGDIATLQPGSIQAQVRSIQVHGEPIANAEFGQRASLNLVGPNPDDVRRGMAIGAPGALYETAVIDVQLRWVGPHRHGQRVRVSVGADEVIGKLFLNDHDRHLAQIRLDAPIACALAQPLIVRRYSPPDLLGGGTVIEPQGQRERKKPEIPIIEAGDLGNAVLEAVGDDPNGVTTEDICRRLCMTPQALGPVFEKILESEAAFGFAGLWIRADRFEVGVEQFFVALSALHDQKPTSAHVPREKVVHMAGLQWAGKHLDRILAHLSAEGRVHVSGTGVRDANFRIHLTPRQRELLDRVKTQLMTESVNVPNPRDLAQMVPAPTQAIDEILKLGIQAGEIIDLGEDIYYAPEQIEALKSQISRIAGRKAFEAAQMRDAIGTSRRYIIPLLEYFDSIGFTTRSGDSRVIT